MPLPTLKLRKKYLKKEKKMKTMISSHSSSPPLLQQQQSLLQYYSPLKSKKIKWVNNYKLSCNAVSRPTLQGREEQHRPPAPEMVAGESMHVIKRHDYDHLLQKDTQRDNSRDAITNRVERIQSMLKSMTDGEISASPYDTAWVALVESRKRSKTGNREPQFPECMEWISKNQQSDGSWGDSKIFNAHDRLINTLACLIALKSWNLYHHQCTKAIQFLEENIRKLGEEKAEQMPIGFEVAFPALLDMVRGFGIQLLPDGFHILRDIYARRHLKLTRIPKEMMERKATTLLHSLEGMCGLNWEKLLLLQSQDGSFLFSPSSTAFALIHTHNPKCLLYLQSLVDRFRGGVPNVYPVDLFERMWTVDRLQRLGISRYFQTQIQDCVNYVHRYWTKKGICWARESEVQDIDDTSMGFRLLRLHGRTVSSDVFENFEKEGEFFCFAGQSTQAVTGMYNLYRASQLKFPGENILDRAKHFSSKFLREKQASNQLLDKWIILKDLPGEVGYALDIPWYADLPRVETRFYIEQYGGEDDVWIGKTLYRMPIVNNNIYLELAILDYNNCQALHRQEWVSVQRWYMEHNLREFGLSQRSLLKAYFLAAASLFEPEKSKERLAWAKTVAMVETIVAYFDENCGSFEHRKAFTVEFRNAFRCQGHVEKRYGKSKGHRLVGPLMSTLNQLSLDALVAHGRNVRLQLYQAWETWLMDWEEEGERYKREAGLIVHTIELCSGRCMDSDQMLSHPYYEFLSNLTNNGVCAPLAPLLNHKGTSVSIARHNDNDNDNNDDVILEQVNSSMEKLVQFVLSDASTADDMGMDPEVKRTFLSVAKTYYYQAYCTPSQISFHIAKVLFDKVRHPLLL